MYLERTDCQYHVGYSVHGKAVGSANSHFEMAVPTERVTRSSEVWRRTTCVTQVCNVLLWAMRSKSSVSQHCFLTLDTGSRKPGLNIASLLGPSDTNGRTFG